MTRLVTRTNESNMPASSWVLETLMRNESKCKWADHSLSEQGQSHIAAPLEVPHRVNTHLIALLPYSHKTTIGRPNLSTVEDITPVVQSSPRSFTVPEAFNRYFRSLQ